jgi:hypothetical protein
MKQSKPTDYGISRRFDGTDELAAFIGKSPAYVRKLAREKIIPFVKLPGRDKLFDRVKVLEALARFEVREIGRGGAMKSRPGNENEAQPSAAARTRYDEDVEDFSELQGNLFCAETIAAGGNAS